MNDNEITKTNANSPLMEMVISTSSFYAWLSTAICKKFFHC